ncbi:NACHT domain-containing protein [Delftia sp. RIT313]|uniref:NACHT domain-containing protein n=1 Tax=Delftia sp. RIT313 TaxID=1468410 RepID=UPI0012680792|nr:ATP-binding protein [Delftia sp. RIT313]
MYIELHRTFRELLPTGRPGDDVAMEPGRGQDAVLMSALLEQPRVVMLAEGGSGKTWLLQEAARRLRSERKAAFFLRLEHVIQEFDGSFDIGSHEDFEAWLASEEPGWVLLDSIDESRLRSSQDFERAVRRVAVKLAKALDRTHILITGRPSAWRPRTDLKLCGQLFPSSAKRSEHPGQGQDEGPVFQVVGLEPLSSSQVEGFVTARGIGLVRPFMDAIERADAGSFTQRPQDLDELVGFWAERGRIGSRQELMNASVQRRLQDNQDRAQAHPMTPARAREGVEKLAAALVLTRLQNIQVPDGPQAGLGLRPRDVLGWDDVEIAALLQRSLFDPDVYGSVRFHHRSVLEYLAAHWFHRLLKQEVSRQRVEALFIREQYGLQVVTPSLRGLLPWLAMSDTRILSRVQQVAPEILFEGGDPLLLPSNVRSAILTDVCKQLASGISDRSLIQYGAIHRFAAPDMCETVRRLIQEYKDKETVTGFLMWVVYHARIADVGPEALQIALSAILPSEGRIAAFHAVDAVGHPSDMAIVRSKFASEGDSLDRRCMAELLNLIDQPDAATLQWLIYCIPRLKEFNEYEVTGLTTATVRFLERTDLSLLPNIIDQLYALLIEPPVMDRHDYYLSVRNRWLRRPIGALLSRLVTARHALALRPSAVATLHVLMRDVPYDEDVHGVMETGLPEQVQAWSALKWAWLWYLVDWLRSEQRVINHWAAQAAMHPIVWDENDFAAAIAATAERDLAEDQRTALEIAFSLYVQVDRPQGLHDQLVSAVVGNEALALRLQQLEAPPEKDDARQKLEQQSAEWTQRNKEAAERARRQRCEKVVFLAGRLDILRNSSFDDPSNVCYEQRYLLNAMRKLDKVNHSRWACSNWRSLEAEFGAPTALAFRDGMVACWRRYSPPLLSEGAQISNMPHADLLGLTGLTVEAVETPGLMASLSPAEAGVAFRYAMREINGFPDWFPALFAAHPQVVAAMLLVEIAFELQMSDSYTAAQYVVARIHSAREWLANAVAHDILSLLAIHSPQRSIVLEHLVDILQVSALSDGLIATLAREQMGAAGSMHHALWAAAWTSVDPGPAIHTVEQHLNVLGDATQRTEFTMAFVAHLLGNRRTSSCMRGAYRTPAVLKRLYLLAHQHVRADKDIDRSGKGVFTPGLRDDAQDAREYLVRLLQDIPGRDSFLALQSLSQEHPHADYRPWLARQALARAQADSERPAWSEIQVSEFAETYERSPANHREMFDLAVMRLLDLKHEMEDSDLSTASVVIRTELETELRNWVAAWCQRHAHGRFVIPQEDELPDAKRPDLRWTCSTFSGAVPTELKIADNWTGPKLFERLEGQLAGDYLRDQASNRGIYLLIWRGAKKHRWELPNGSFVDFVTLVAALQSHGTYVAAHHPGVEEIQVIGIDLTKRANKAGLAPPTEG